jgi:hypothetical protein
MNFEQAQEDGLTVRDIQRRSTLVRDPSFGEKKS